MDFMKFMSDGGIFMWPILICLVLSIAVMLERTYALLIRYSVNGNDLTTKVKKNLMANKVQKAIATCDSKPNAALARVFKAGLVSAERSIDDIQRAVDNSATEVIQLLSRRTPFLASLANVATLVGLLGTIQGLVESFAAVGSASAEERQTLLAAGISVAMYTTAFGLIAAIPCLVAYSLIQNKTTVLIDDIDRYSAQLMEMLRTMKEGGFAGDSGRRGAVEEDGE